MTALMYHDVVPHGLEDSSGFPGRDSARYKVTPAQFEAHLEAISLHVSQRLLPTITFDDGGVSALAAADALERYARRGHCFVTVNYIGTRGFLDPAGIRALERRGHVVGSHSCSHPLRMGHLSPARLVDEWVTSRAALSEILGHGVQSASLPGGDFAAAVATAAADAGFTQLFTSEPMRRVRQVGALTIAGRFTIHCRTSPATVAALAVGCWLPCARQVLAWNAKKVGKRIGGEHYLQARRLLFRNPIEVRWGDNRPASVDLQD